jgi:anti-anti-sigma factor
MSIAVEFTGSTARITLSGDIDYSTQEEIQAHAKTVLAATGIKEIHADLGNVTFLDSSGIRALLTLQKKASADGIQLILFNCRNPIREIFEIGGFDRMFTIQ